MSLFTEQYRFADRLPESKVTLSLTAEPGYFRLGKAVCYGRTRAGLMQPDARRDLYDVLPEVSLAGRGAILPFSPDEIIENLRFERYMGPNRDQARNILLRLARKTYYMFRPLMPVRIRKHLQRIYLQDWKRIAFPAWPVDRSVETIFEELLILSLQSYGHQRIPFIWFWPDGYNACSIVTHDIETQAGRDFSLRLADLDASFGVKSSFQIVPEERYEVPGSFLDALRARGCEVNLHGLNHDGQLFRDRTEFLRQVERINRYRWEYRAAGFRSPVMYRNVNWYGDLEFSYDMSIPNVGHLEAQRGGCCTVMPYFIGNLVELPLTTTQDYQLFNIIRDRSIALWKQQISLITEKHGLVSFNVHPDYMISDGCREVYRQLLDYMVRISADQRIWLALPGEVDQWWRRRREMRLVQVGGKLRVIGPSSERAVIAYASLDHGRIVYEVLDSLQQLARSPA